MNRTKWPRVALVLLALGLVLVALIIWQLFRPANDARLQALGRKGYPVTPAELDAWYPRPPDHENAALIYTNVFAQPLFTNLSGFFLDNRWLPVRGKPIKEQDEKELLSFFAANQQSLQWLYSAAALPQSRYPIDLKQAATTPVLHLAGMKRATDLLSGQGFFFATKANNEEAVKAFIAAGRVADSSSREPLIISQLVRYACWAVLWSRLEL